MSLAAVFFAALLHSPPLTGAVDELTHGVSSAYFEIHESRRLSPSSGVAVSSKVASPVECALACRRLPWCLSYNFQKTPYRNGGHICECLDVGGNHTNTEDLMPSEEFDHYSVLVRLSIIREWGAKSCITTRGLCVERAKSMKHILTVPPPRGGIVFIIFSGGGVPPGPENPYPISDQKVRFFVPYFRPDS